MRNSLPRRCGPWHCLRARTLHLQDAMTQSRRIGRNHESIGAEGSKRCENRELSLYFEFQISYLEFHFYSSISVPPFQGLRSPDLNPGLAPWVVLSRPFRAKDFTTAKTPEGWRRKAQGVSPERAAQEKRDESTTFSCTWVRCRCMGDCGELGFWLRLCCAVVIHISWGPYSPESGTSCYQDSGCGLVCRHVILAPFRPDRNEFGPARVSGSASFVAIFLE